jgi:hypothetical protein
LTFLGFSDKLAIARAMLAIRASMDGARSGSHHHARLAARKAPTERAIRRFWNQVLVSAINEDLDRMAASHGFQVFWLGFLARANAYEMGIPAVPLGDLYGPEAGRIPNVRTALRAPVERVIIETARFAE